MPVSPIFKKTLKESPEEQLEKIDKAEVKKKHEETSKEELKKITKGVSDKEFFEIVSKYAQPYVSDDFKLRIIIIKL